MATLQPFPKFRAFDLDGNPLSGGFVYTYAAGTSTPLVTYTDSSGDPASENTNPVELDAAGEANIWYGDNLYKLALFNADNVLQWTVDNIGSGSSSSVTNVGFGEATDIASASIVDLGTVTSHFANITGTTTITGFGSSALITAPVYLVKFEGALTLTQGANLFLPNSANIITAQNDRALVEYLGSGSWRVFSYMRADGTSVAVTPITLGGTGQITAALAFDAIKQAATASYTGVVELSNDAEARTGTSTVLAVTPANLEARHFESAQQTITAAGSLTIAHGLGKVPSMCGLILVCTTAELGYSVNDRAQTFLGAADSAFNFGATVVADATNLKVRFGSSTPTFLVHNKTTGATTQITNSSWRAVFTATLN